MPFFSSKILQTLLSLGLLFTLLFYLISGTPNLINTQSNTIKTVADSYITRGSSRQYREDGKLDYLLLTEALQHFNVNNLSILEQPELYIYKQGKVSWTASAQHGEVQHGQEAIELQNTVVLKDHELSVKLTTEAMTILPTERTAHSKVHTKIRNNHSTLEAQSMSADLNTQRATMKAKVKGYYENP